ncbi:ABC transporter ATP-binding protein [Calditerricola satsumensis]|uniref:Putative siderophore transport system ATP-binding protein YusV n=1 Tax=Calditerricola satsumensis TaxID=373054 RepID=A0A8J3B7H1_9BACI|nr:ABC transporter ATP-binding protein [Calditerricola satsumensis]GGJ91121.1 putative siderophore transport system ATP-binding protein YusV [Calditerricola satsumensis]
MPMLESRQLTVAYGDAIVLDQLDLRVPPGKITVLIGRNGCGKSTLLRALARLLKPQGGAVYLDGRAIAKLPTREVAKQLAILPQSPVAPEGLTVLGLIKQGRYPYQNWLNQWSEEDERMVRQALEWTGMVAHADRPVDALSGGQRQRAWIAMALAQGTPILLLDEPTTYLDLAHQIEILDLLAALNAREGRTIVMVLHDLNLACRYAHHLVVLRDGAVYAQGAPEEIVSEDLVREVFGVDCKVVPDPLYGTPLCIPHSRFVPAVAAQPNTGHAV